MNIQCIYINVQEVSLYKEEEIIGAIDSIKNEIEESNGEQLLMTGQDVATEEQQTPIIPHRIRNLNSLQPTKGKKGKLRTHVKDGHFSY